MCGQRRRTAPHLHVRHVQYLATTPRYTHLSPAAIGPATALLDEARPPLGRVAPLHGRAAVAVGGFAHCLLTAAAAPREWRCPGYSMRSPTARARWSGGPASAEVSRMADTRSRCTTASRRDVNPASCTWIRITTPRSFA